MEKTFTNDRGYNIQAVYDHDRVTLTNSTEYHGMFVTASIDLGQKTDDSQIHYFIRSQCPGQIERYSEHIIDVRKVRGAEKLLNIVSNELCNEVFRLKYHDDLDIKKAMLNNIKDWFND